VATSVIATKSIKNVIVNLVNVIKKIKEHILFIKIGHKTCPLKMKLNLYRRKNGKSKN